MCDYSLHAIQNRLAVAGEHLRVHRFQTGSIGLAAPPPEITDSTTEAKEGFWRKIFRMATEPRVPECAVCIPPGARLILHDISDRMQRDLRVSCSEEVTFTQLTARENSYRDAVRFSRGETVLLQHLHPGQRVHVISVASSEDEYPMPVLEELNA